MILDFAKPLDMRTYSPITLAFVGDAVYELLVRQYIAQHMNAPANKLHLKAVERVCCTFQSRAFARIEPVLTQEEADVFRCQNMQNQWNTGGQLVWKPYLVICT